MVAMGEVISPLMIIHGGNLSACYLISPDPSSHQANNELSKGITSLNRIIKVEWNAWDSSILVSG